MREIRLYGSEGGGTGCSPYPYQTFPAHPEFQPWLTIRPG